MYREISPPNHLRNHIVCFWHRPANAPASESRILPDGCIDIIWAGETPPFVAGPMTAPAVPMTAAETEIIGVRFRPGSAPAHLGVSASELLDAHVPLRAIWPHDRHQPLADAAAASDVSARMSAIAAAIALQLDSGGQPDPLASEVARWIAGHPSGSLAGLGERTGLSEWQIRRRFDDAIGYGPKTLQRVMRMQRLLWLASQPENQRLTLGRLAFAAGYADQPHMTREVTALAGTSPGRLLRGGHVQSAVSDLFKTPAR